MREALRVAPKTTIALYALGEIECLFGSELQIASAPAMPPEFPSPIKSFTPVTVTGCGIFQFVGVKVRVFGLTVPSSVFELVIVGIITFPIGGLRKTTLKEKVEPVSEVKIHRYTLLQCLAGMGEDGRGIGIKSLGEFFILEFNIENANI